MNATRTILIGLLASAALLSGCRGDRSDKPPRQLFPDMDDMPRWKAQSESPMFMGTGGSRTDRPRVEGTIAFGNAPLDPDEFGGYSWYQAGFGKQRDQMLRDDAAMDHGVSAGVDYRYAWQNVTDPSLYVADIPMPVSDDLLALGQEKFNIYCATCHGYAGEGGGVNVVERGGLEVEEPYGALVGQRWSIPVPGFHDAKYLKDAPGERGGRDGYLYYTAMYGVGFTTPDDLGKGNNMPGYKHALTQEEAWGVVAYIRALQVSRRFPYEALREDVDDERGVKEILDRTSGAQASRGGEDTYASEGGE